MLRILLILTSLIIAGCISSGNQELKKHDESSIASIIVKGKTSKADVKAIFGDPSDIDFDNHGREKWTYTHTKGNVKAENFIPVVSMFRSGVDTQTKKLVIIFDRETGIVYDYLTSSAKEEIKHGIVPQ